MVAHEKIDGWQNSWPEGEPVVRIADDLSYLTNDAKFVWGNYHEKIHKIPTNASPTTQFAQRPGFAQALHVVVSSCQLKIAQRNCEKYWLYAVILGSGF